VPADRLVAIVRQPAKAADLAAAGVAVRPADYNDPAALDRALAGIDRLLLISSNEIGQRAAQHQRVIDAAVRQSVRRLVYTSLLHADTSSLSLAEEHLGTEAVLKASGVPYVLLRNGWYTENYTGSVQGALTGGALVGSAGDGRISSAPRADYADAAVAVLTSGGHEGKTYELSGDESYTLTDLAAEITRQSGKEIPYKNLPESEYADVLKGFGVPDLYANALAGWDTSASKGDLYDDSHQLSKLTGRKTTPLASVVKEALKGND